VIVSDDAMDVDDDNYLEDRTLVEPDIELAEMSDDDEDATSDDNLTGPPDTESIKDEKILKILGDMKELGVPLGQFLSLLFYGDDELRANPYARVAHTSVYRHPHLGTLIQNLA
jgi:hypothetical protein